MTGPYQSPFGAGPVGPPPPFPGPPQPYPDNPVAGPVYPGTLPPPVPYPRRRRWPVIAAALGAVTLLAAAVLTVVLLNRPEHEGPGELTTASAKTAIQDYLDALTRGDDEAIARNALCGLFDAVKERKSDLALADLTSDTFRKQFSAAHVTSVDKMVFSSPNQAQVLFTMDVTPAGSRTQPPPTMEEQAVAQLLAQDNEILVCSYLLRVGGQY